MSLDSAGILYRLRDLMENVILIIHLLLALGLIAVVLMQRSEVGGLGMGSGGGGNTTSGRTPPTALSKVTWVLATAFICTSVAMTIIAARNSSGTSVIDRLGVTPPAATETETGDGALPVAPLGDSLLPPAEGDNAPLVPRAD
jgi:preprotein translocase subunit SecG